MAPSDTSALVALLKHPKRLRRMRPLPTRSPPKLLPNVRVGGEQRAGSTGHRGRARVRAAVAERTAEEVEVGLRLAEGEAGELDERTFRVDTALRGFAGGGLEAGAGIGAQGAVFGLRANIQRRHPAGAHAELGESMRLLQASALVLPRLSCPSGIRIQRGPIRRS
jgi:hypothetical protein